MAAAAQKRASEAYRRRLAEAGLKRFEVRAPAQDQALIRALAGKLAKGDAEAEKVRAELTRTVADDRSELTPKADDPRPKGGVWAAMRQWPRELGELDLTREEWVERDIDL